MALFCQRKHTHFGHPTWLVLEATLAVAAVGSKGLVTDLTGIGAHCWQNGAGRDWGKRSKLRTSETVGSHVGRSSVFLLENHSAHRRRYRLRP